MDRACVLSKFGSKDCYRTPPSGGHKFAGESDLVISPSLQRVVPFCIECKHHKTLRTSHLFHPTELLKKFHAQVLKAAARDPFERSPLLVLRGGDMETYAALPSSALLAQFQKETSFEPPMLPLLMYEYKREIWSAMPWSLFLDLVRFRSNLLPAELSPTNLTIEAPKNQLLLADKSSSQELATTYEELRLTDRLPGGDYP